MAAAAAGYLHERNLMERSRAQQIAERVQRLLAGDRSAEEEIDYPIDGWHVGLIATGERTEGRLLETATKLGCKALLLPQGGETVWAWLGRPTSLTFGEIERALEGNRTGLSVAAGEPRHGFDGWRLTHQEAQAGLEILRRGPQRFVRGSDVALMAAVLRDEPLRESLQETFLAPLDRDGRGGVLRETLHAYFAADGNEVAAAAALRINRQTVHRRLGKVEEILGRLLYTCRPELEVLLSLQRLREGEEAL
ncbi:MAG: PucR family transcriptional regulator [Solirubrobacterales bacterium]